ncbi:chorismate--pyruvate lyase family protein [Legionella oakridgensis]|uniref:4-hydroxybenzoate synthetase n=2 Tax=Legionella oakridgensis TaxID=29423 RepID=W0BF80_9GAMM|nr:chorismate lyase [Legionella oakridgensis]AHE67331.1 4-hydroxybenzoate synthetase [Legionella oakridgensis ATCC 33761 = DSM 21215]ETO93081.1 chorismate lyase [Legionella oakridgensis RV-2-2007]KTD37883.1 4-hydroxybenzoate synthetase [Legionella oakridgensis]STY20395.1 4-hydroxybenzoate synthetase [Legionella longbeachae]
MLINPDNFLQEECHPSYALLPWITHQSSLTERLKQKTGEARLTVLAQQWGAPDWWDKQVLKLEHESVLHREILMSARNAPCWYGRTILPKQTYESDVALFTRLKTESLGQLLFNNITINRLCLLHYAISHRVIEYHWLTAEMHDQKEVLWARFSAFTLHKQFPFYLVEILLPGLMRYVN